MRRRFLVLLAGIVLLAGTALLLVRGGEEAGFRVQGTELLAPDGEPFVIRGVVMPYGTFAGGPGAGAAETNFRELTADLRRVRHAGGNLIRVFVDPKTLGAGGFDRLDRVVAEARGQGFVVQLSGAFATAQAARPLVRQLAEHFNGDPWVWLQPMNEPQCTTAEDKALGHCGDWGRWQADHRAYLNIIRAAGVTSPVVVNTPNFSTDLRELDRHPLDDDQVLFGVHRYGNERASFTGDERRLVEAQIGEPSRRHPTFVDEVGNFNGPQFPNAIAWSDGMTRWAAGWIARGDGLGATGFNWRWSDANTMIDGAGKPTPWGTVFTRNILRPGAGSVAR